MTKKILLPAILMGLVNYASAQDVLECQGWRKDADATRYYIFKVSPFDVSHIGQYTIKVDSRRRVHVPGTGEPHWIPEESTEKNGSWLVNGNEFKFLFEGGELSGTKTEQTSASRPLFVETSADKEVVLKLVDQEPIPAVCFFKKREVRLSFYMSAFLSSVEYEAELRKAREAAPQGYRINVARIYTEPKDSFGRETIRVILEAENFEQKPFIGVRFGEIEGVVKNPGPASSYKVLKAEFKRVPTKAE